MSTIPQDVQTLVDKIHKHCNKIYVAKKETSQLADLCDDLIKRLDGSQQPNYSDIRSNLSNVEERLAGWSKFNYPKSLMKRAYIESGVTECVEQLNSVILRCPVAQPAPVSLPGGQGIGPSNGGGVEGIPQGEGTSEGVASVMTGVGHNAGTFVTSTKNADDDVGFVNIQKVRFNEPSLIRTTEPESQPVETNETPSVKRLDGEVVRLGEIAFSGGTYCEIWAGRWKKPGDKEADGEKVALKAFRSLKFSEKTRKKLERELSRWAELYHPNILPFYGIVTDIGPHPCMVSPWQENGNLLAYVRGNPQTNKIHLLRGSAAGLNHLHSQDIVHGSVKCKNVLISHEAIPLICDFGMARIMEEVTESTATKTGASGDAVRYSAIELIEGNNVSATKHSDTYSFAMLMLECITEEMPFSNLSRDAAVIHARISKRQCPLRPSGENPRKHISDELWNYMMLCWSISPNQRPTMDKVLETLQTQPT